MAGEAPRPGNTTSFPGLTPSTIANSEHPICAVFFVDDTGSLILPSNWNGPRIRLLNLDSVAGTHVLPHRPPPTHIRVALYHQQPAALRYPSTSQSQGESVQSTHAECLSSGRRVWLVSLSVQHHPVSDPVFNPFWLCSTVSDLLSHALAHAPHTVPRPGSSPCPQPLDFVVASRPLQDASAMSLGKSPSTSNPLPVPRIHFSSFALNAQPSHVLDGDHLDSGVLLAIQSLLHNVTELPGRSYRARNSTTRESHGPLFKPVVVRTSLGPRSGWCLRLIDGILLAMQTNICQAGCASHAEEVDVATLDPETLSMPSPLRSFFKSGSLSSNGVSGPQNAAPSLDIEIASPPGPTSATSRIASPMLDLVALSTSMPAQATYPPPPPSPIFRAPDSTSWNSTPAFLDAPYSFTLPTSTLHSMPRSSSSGPSIPMSLPFTTASPAIVLVRRSHSTSELFRIARRQRELLANIIQRNRNDDTVDSSRSSLGQLPTSDPPSIPTPSLTVSAAQPPVVHVVAATPRSSQAMTQPEARVSTLSATGEIDLSSLDDLFAAPRRGFHTSLTTASFRAVPPVMNNPISDPMQGLGLRNAGSRRLKEPPEPGPDGQRTLCNACGLKYARSLRSTATTEVMPPELSTASSAASSSTLGTSSSGGNMTPQQVTLERDSAVSGLNAPAPTSTALGSAQQLSAASNGRLRMAEIDGDVDLPPIGAQHQASPSSQPRPGA
ncbi:hypothetical protein BCR44DRAFT_1435051 [Catenaria anguillulae PL171]|uniref:GATA-type domain-containing protein n=1 Tax=Catenaria anguillulae PL171 TaxID=765915 RepID=A0A1Y2HM89_9FUNG|nr:hypothetical protein BCR44DRAFT_1435051 [Catenaria anguillulae PL171]